VERISRQVHHPMNIITSKFTKKTYLLFFLSLNLFFSLQVRKKTKFSTFIFFLNHRIKWKKKFLWRRRRCRRSLRGVWIFFFFKILFDFVARAGWPDDEHVSADVTEATYNDYYAHTHTQHDSGKQIYFWRVVIKPPNPPKSTKK
jgi:hypothetical protein